MKSNRNIFFRILALFVIVVLFNGTSFFFSMNTNGAEVLNSFNKATSFYEKKIKKDLNIVEEDVTKRGEYEKHFFMNDGSYIAVSYNEPVHFYKNNQWLEIDNTLEEIDIKNGKEKRISNKNGRMKVSFAKNMTDHLVIVESNGHTISWDIIAGISSGTNAKNQNNQNGIFADANLEYNLANQIAAFFCEETKTEIRTETINHFNGEDTKLLPQKNNSGVIYKNVFGEDIDINYNLSPTRIKEDIVINSPTEIISYIVEITVSDLSASLLEDNTVVFTDEQGEVQSIFQAPYMFDSDGAFSDRIVLELEQVKDDKYILTMIPDKNWLDSSERVYPITIDPILNTDNAASNVVDTYTYVGDSTSIVQSNRNATTMYIGQRNTTSRVYYKHKVLPTPPANSLITSATLYLNFYSGTSTAKNIDVYFLGQDWVDTLCWTNQPAISGTVGTNIAYNTDSNNKPVGFAIDVTWITKYWCFGGHPNHGLMLRYHDESAVPTDYNRFYSSDSTTNKPLYYINYTEHNPSYISDGTYYIKNVKSGLYLDVQNFATANGTVCKQYRFNGGLNQIWNITNIGNQTYTLRPMHHQSSALDVSTSNAALGADVDIWSAGMNSPPRYVQWQFVSTGSSSYRIMSASSNYYCSLAVLNASTAEGAKCVQYYYGSSDNDDWVLEPVMNVTSEHLIDGTILANRANWYRFVPTISGFHTFSTTGSIDTYGTLYQGTSLLQNNDDGGSGRNFRITQSLTEGTEYILKVRGYSSSTSGSYTLKVRRPVNHWGNIKVGLSADSYANGTCSFGQRGSIRCTNDFWSSINNWTNTELLFYHFNDGDSHSQVYGTKRDFLPKAFYNITHDNIDDVDLMLFAGHGFNNNLHWTQGPNNAVHKNTPGDHSNINLNFHYSEAKFGYGSARTKWVVAYTCNYLNGNLDDLKTMLQGANMILGYSTAAYLVNTQMEVFGKNLKDGMAVMDAFFDSRSEHSKYADFDATLRVIYVDAAEKDTIYKYLGDTDSYLYENILSQSRVARKK